MDTSTWKFGIAGGAVYNFRSPLRIQQDAAAPILINAHYITEPFTPPVYYDVRVSYWKEAKGWQLKFTHHKLILQNRLPEVQRFYITDGFNLLTLNRLWRSKWIFYSVGGGVVITHPESTIRSRMFPENVSFFKKGTIFSGPLWRPPWLNNSFLGSGGLSLEKAE
jgi:hypothetical protein